MNPLQLNRILSGGGAGSLTILLLNRSEPCFIEEVGDGTQTGESGLPSGTHGNPLTFILISRMFSYQEVFRAKRMALWGKTSPTAVSKASDIQAQTKAQFLVTPKDQKSLLLLMSCFLNKPTFSEAKTCCVLKSRHKRRSRSQGIWNSQRCSQKPFPFPKQSTWSSLGQNTARRTQVTLLRGNPKVFPWVSSY